MASANQLPLGTAFILPKAEVCVRNHVQPYIPSILEALMVPTSQGFTEVRDVFFKEVTDMNLNIINEGGIDKLGEVRPAPAPPWEGAVPLGFGSGPHCDPGWAECTKPKLLAALLGAGGEKKGEPTRCHRAL